MNDIVIEQDWELDGDGELGGPLDVFWARGHGHEERAFIHAVVEHCMNEDHDVPRITLEHSLREVWQTITPCGDSIAYNRVDKREDVSPYARAADIEAVTVLDLDSRARGNHRCSVRDCREPWNAGVPIQVVSFPDPAPHVSVEVWLCRTHNEVMPAAYYRMAIVPIGTEIVLPKPDGVAS